MSLYPCTTENCSCKEFISNPWKDDKCINCWHVHGPKEEPSTQNTKTFQAPIKFATGNIRATIKKKGEEQFSISPVISPKNSPPATLRENREKTTMFRKGRDTIKVRAVTVL